MKKSLFNKKKKRKLKIVCMQEESSVKIKQNLIIPINIEMAIIFVRRVTNELAIQK